MTNRSKHQHRADHPPALPDVEIFQLTAIEVAASSVYEEEQHEFMRRPEYRLATISSKERNAMLAAMVQELNIEGGWFYWFSLPGRLPDSDGIVRWAGPFKTYQAALEDTRSLND